MNYIFIFWECIILIIFLGIGTLIFRMIAKEYEWDTSYKKAFIVIFLYTITSSLLFIIPALIVSGLSNLVVLNNLLFFILIALYVVFFGLTLYFGVLIIRRFYECDFKESFSMLRLYIFYDIIIMIPISPILYGIL